MIKNNEKTIERLVKKKNLSLEAMSFSIGSKVLTAIARQNSDMPMTDSVMYKGLARTVNNKKM